MLTLKEKEYLLALLKKQKRRSWFGLRKLPPEHGKLMDKLAQMIRNEQVNREHL